MALNPTPYRPEPEGSLPPAISAPAGARRSLRVLLAEDNAVNQALIRMLLDKQGHQVRVTVNGRAALEALFPEGASPGSRGEPAFDLVLMDVQMPEMDGWEATQLIRAREKGTGRHVPVIALTGQVMEGDREDCLRAGMDGYVSKPVQAAELFQVIQSVLPDADKAPEYAGSGRPAETGLNWRSLLARMGGREHRLRKIVAVFLEESAKLTQTMREAVAAGDADRLRRAAHSLKGALGIFGVDAATQAAQHLESLAASAPMSAAGEALALLNDALGPVQRALAEMVKDK